MTFSTQTMWSVLFKKLFGKANTDAVNKDLFNEAKNSLFAPIANATPALDIPSSPTATLYSITSSGTNQAVEYLRLVLVADPTSNGHAYFAQLPAAYQTNSTNTKSGTSPFTNNSVLVDSAGKLQIVPAYYGLSYEPKPYVGGTTAQGSGTLIPLGDARKWYFDTTNGVFYQEDTSYSAPSYIECFVYVGQMVSDGLSLPGFSPSSGSAQDRTMKLVRGGIWSWNSGTNQLAYTADAFVQIAGLAENRNTIPVASSPITLASDGQVAYVEVNRTAGASANLTVSVAAVASVPLDGNTFVIARRVGTDVLVGSMSFRLINGQSTELDQGLSVQTRTLLGTSYTAATSSPAWNTILSAPLRTIASDSTSITSAVASVDTQIDKFFGQTRMTPKTGDNTRVKISSADVSMLDSVTRSLTINSRLMSFTGAEIDIDTGNIYASDGLTLIGTFTPLVPGVGNYAWYSVALSQGTTNGVNQTGVTINVLAGSSDGASAALAPRATFYSGGTPIGQFSVFNNAGSVQLNTLVQLGSAGGGGGGGGSGGAGSVFLIGGGDWSWISGTLAWSAAANIAVPGLADSVNNILSGSIGLTSGQVAYVDINVLPPGGNLTVISAAESSLSMLSNRVILARCVGTTVYVGVGGITMMLIANESKYLGQGLSDQNITYIGIQTGESDFDPAYTTANGGPTANSYITDGDNLTRAIKKLDTQLLTASSMNLQTAYDNCTGGTATITTNGTDGSVVIAGNQSLKVSATNGLDMTTTNITSTTLNQGLVCKPNGTGSFVVDSTTATAGNARGTNAVDLQLNRALATQVASGNYSVIAGGYNNTASASASAILGGFSNSATLGSSGVVAGNSNTAGASNAVVVGGTNNSSLSVSSVVVGGVYNSTNGTGSVAFGYGGYTSGTADFSVGNNSGIGATPTTEVNNHFHIDGTTSEVHIGRYMDQSTVSGATNLLCLHTINASNQSKFVSLGVPTNLTANVALTLPNSTGTASQYLQTDGSGNLSWATVNLNSVSLNQAYLNGNTITTTLGSGSVIVAGTQSLQITTTLGLDMTTKTITTTTVNGAIFLVPNGSGALQATTDGNARGLYATDWQRARTAATQVAGADYSVIGGGYKNSISAGGTYSSIVGGENNYVGNEHSVVAGGIGNQANGSFSFVGGGSSNSTGSSYSAVVAGQSNSTGATRSTVVGGSSNYTGAADSSVLGGTNNTTNAASSAILGGVYNTISGAAAIGGGYGSWTNVAADFVLGNNASVGASPTTYANVYLRAAGDTSDLHLGRFVDQASVSGATNTLFLHTINASNQSKSVSLKAPTNLTANVAFTLPGADGTSGQAIVTNASGVLSFASFANQALSNLASVAINTALLPNGDNTLNLGSTSLGWQYGYINKLALDSNGQTTIIQGSTSATASVTYSLPPADGTSGQALTTNAAGVLGWSSFANQALSNLASVAINTALLPSGDNTLNLGSTSLGWQYGYINKLALDSNAQTTTIQGSASASASVVYSLPPADGTSGQALTTNAAGVLGWSSFANQALSNLASVAINTSLIPAGNNSIDLGSASLGWQYGYINKLVLDSNSQSTTIQGSATATASVTYTLPPADGSANQVLTTNGAGVLGWKASSGGGSAKSPADGFQSLVFDAFDLPPSDPLAKVDNSHTTGVYDATNALYAMACDKTQTITTTGTSYQLSGSPSYTMAANNVICSGGVLRRVASISSQTIGTLDAAFPVDLSNPLASGTATVTQSAVSNVYMMAQRIQARWGASIFALVSTLKKTGTPTGNIVYQLYSDVGGFPGSLLASSYPINVATTITTSFGGASSSLTSPYLATTGTYYWMVVDTTGVTYSGGTIDYQTVSPQNYTYGYFALSTNSGTSYVLQTTTNMAFSVQCSNPCQVSQAMWTVDLVNYGSAAQKTRLRDFFPSTSIMTSHVEYSDSLVAADAIADQVDTARVVVAATNSGLQSDVTFPTSDLYAPFFTRPNAPNQYLDYPLTTNTNTQRMFLCFFPNPNNVSVTANANVINYDCSVYAKTLLNNGGFLNTSFCMSDGSGTANNCSNPTYNGGTGNTRVILGFNYVPGINSGYPDGDLDVIVEGQVIPRYYVGVIGTYWTEVVGYTNIIEISGNLTTLVPAVSIHVRRRQGSIDTSSAGALRWAAMWDAVVGSASQVTSGLASYSSIQSAINAMPVSGGARILVLSGTYTETVTISSAFTSGLTIIGKGLTTIINGNFSMQGYGCSVDDLQVMNGVWSISGNANFAKGWLDPTATFSNTGLGNDYRIIAE